MSYDVIPARVLRVLIVEDDDGDFVLTSECLRKASGADFDLLRARTLGEASALLHAQPVDLVLLDLSLPDSRGWSTFTRLHGTAAGVPVIVLTGCDDQDGALHALAEGAQDYVLKTDVNAETLARAVRYALERHKAETALRQYRDHLEQLVESRSQALEETNRKLRSANMSLSKALEELKKHQQKLIRYERLSALGQVTGGLMQEFGDLFMPVIGYSEMLLENPEMLDEREHARDLLQRIRDSALKASDALRRLRQLYKPADDSERRPIDLNRLIMRIIEDTRLLRIRTIQGASPAIRIETDFDPIGPVRGHEAQLSEALASLVNNAIDAMPEGGVLTLRTIANGEFITVEVSDTGTGMPDEIRRRCFDPFFTTKGAQAAGLGLPMAQGIIASHGGDITVASWVKQGTRVTVTLPAESMAPAAPDRGLRILVIDDDPQVLHLLRTHLSHAHHKVATAETAKGGLEKLDSEAFDLVITDRAMPDQSGDDIARTVRRCHPGTTVVMLSGFGDWIKSEGSLPEGVDRIVSKPVALAEIDRIITEVAAPPQPAAGAGRLS